MKHNNSIFVNEITFIYLYKSTNNALIVTPNSVWQNVFLFQNASHYNQSSATRWHPLDPSVIAHTLIFSWLREVISNICAHRNWAPSSTSWQRCWRSLSYGMKLCSRLHAQLNWRCKDAEIMLQSKLHCFAGFVFTIYDCKILPHCRKKPRYDVHCHSGDEKFGFMKHNTILGFFPFEVMSIYFLTQVVTCIN